MKTQAHELPADWHTQVRGHLSELARYCGVPVATVRWWWVAGLPVARHAEVSRFARVIVALERKYDSQFARTLLQLAARAAEERRLLRSLLQRPTPRRRYRVVVREA